MGEKTKTATPEGEHIFPNTKLTELCLRWKDLAAGAEKATQEAGVLRASGRSMEADECDAEAREQHSEAFQILEQVIEGSTPMFQRLAQHENFTMTLPLDILVQAARLKVAHWMRACKTELLHEKKLFSYFSTCAKHAFLSEIAKNKQFNTRFHTTSDSLEKFVGAEDHTVDRHDLAAELHRMVQDITVRWGNPQELGAVRYALDCIIETEPGETANKNAILRGMVCAYGISDELAKFFYQWALFALRDALYDKQAPRFTEQDLFRHKESYTFWPDIIDIIGWQKAKELIVKLGGHRVKIPTRAQLTRDHDDFLLHLDIQASDLTPGAIETIGKKRGRSARHATEIFHEMSDILAHTRSGEHPLYTAEEH